MSDDNKGITMKVTYSGQGTVTPPAAPTDASPDTKDG